MENVSRETLKAENYLSDCIVCPYCNGSGYESDKIPCACCLGIKYINTENIPNHHIDKGITVVGREE